MAKTMMMRDVILQTIRDEMARDKNVMMLGEDIVGGMGTAGGPEAIGGIWSTSTGLFGEFGGDRVIDTPISESAIIGAAAGAALAGKRPIAELMFADFVGVCMDQIWNQIAKFRYMFGGKSKCPVVIRLVYGGGFNAAPQHSQAVYSMMTSMPGLKVVLPSTPADAKGLLTQAIRDDDPVLFFEHKALYAMKGEVPEDEYLIPFGHARHVRAGEHVTIAAMGMMVGQAERAADELAKEGISCDLLDLRTTSPLDEEAILDSVEQTGRFVIVDESPPRCSVATDVAAMVANKAFAALKAPPQMVTAPHSPVPFARELESAYLPSAPRIVDAVRTRAGVPLMAALKPFAMPKWGIEMTEGTVAEWLVPEGESYTKGTLLTLIETDKITNEVEAEAPGTLARILVPAGETQPVGALLAVISDGPATAAEVDAFVAQFKPADALGSASRDAEKQAPPPEPKAEVAAATAPGKPAVHIPEDANISPAARKLAEERGVEVGGIAGSGKGGRISLQDVDQASRPAAPGIGGGAVSIAVGTEALDAFYASPLAKRLAVQHGVDLAGITGTGRRGRISKADVLAKLPEPAPAPAPAAASSAAPVDNTPEILPMSPLRKTIARRLTEAKQSIPHFYLRTEVGVDALLALRPTANLILGAKASVNDYIVRAVALALVEVPDVNVQVQGDAIHRFPHADVAVAVASEKGLVTPIVRGADRLRLDVLSATIKGLVAKAQAGKLAADDITGGTFTVSNLGMFGLDQFDAIINPPQGAILAVGASRKVFAPGPDGEGRFETRIALSLSCDHRAIDGATGAKFLAALKAIIEEPTRLFAAA